MKLIYLLPLSLLLACGNSKDLGVTESQDPISEETSEEIVVEEDEPFLIVSELIPTHNVAVTITHFTPYCGGAHPSDEILDRQYQLQGNTAFILLNLETLEKVNVQTNAKGILYLNLPKGRYAIRELFKECSFSEFVERNPPRSGSYIVPSPDSDCYRNWWSSHLGEFEITDPAQLQSFTWGTGDRCFTGSNPCIEYNGPYPP